MIGTPDSSNPYLSRLKPEGHAANLDGFQPVFLLPDTPERKTGGLRIRGLYKHTLPEFPLFSIVTIVLNGEKYLEQTIQSVLGQSYKNVEYLIIDGGSTDGTLDIINKYEDRIDYWVSEPDQGIADGFNKGILLSTGDIIGLINSDDWYESDALKTVHEAMNGHDIVHGPIKVWRDSEEWRIVESTLDGLSRLMTVNHPSCFVKRGVYQDLGLFDTRLSIAVDYDFILRCRRYGKRFETTGDVVVANMRVGGVSEKYFKSFREIRRAKINNGLGFWKSTLFFLLQIAAKLVRITLTRLGVDVDRLYAVSIRKRGSASGPKWRNTTRGDD